MDINLKRIMTSTKSAINAISGKIASKYNKKETVKMAEKKLTNAPKVVKPKRVSTGGGTRGPKPKKNAHVTEKNWKPVVVTFPPNLLNELQTEAATKETNVASIIRDVVAHAKKWEAFEKNG